VQLWVRSLPRYYTETVAVTGILLVILILLTQGREMGTVLPTLSLFAAAAYRLVPSANRIVSLVHQIRHNAYALDTIYDGLVLSEQPGRGRGTLQDSQIVEALPPIRDGVRLENVTYRYSDPPTTALRDISLYIPRGHIVGFVGPSGAGKTTVVDVILGLLTPTEGRVLVDGHDIQDNLRAWQAKLGYIPQEIYLLDDTLRANIAFGIQPDQMDETSVSQAVKAAQLGEWIESLPDGLDTMVGEEGVRISGGQRQRVGIARALYHNPELLIMDEATASLDNQMEAEVMKAILRLSGQKTILIIAHRLTTVKNCHRLYFMQYGRIVASGTYDELLDYSAEFQAMARLVDDR
jgi:ABC-type multidrug transport system fused ATPase/permease subunit